MGVGRNVSLRAVTGQLAGYPLLDALIERRSRRFGLIAQTISLGLIASAYGAYHVPATFCATIRRLLFPVVAVRCRIGLSKPISLLAVACCFCVLRSEWCQRWCQYPHREVDRSPQGPSAQTKLWWREAAGGSTMNMQNCRRELRRNRTANLWLRSSRLCLAPSP